MKRVRCPKCDNYITFDETKYQTGQSLIFECPECGKNFGIRMGVSKLRNTQKDEQLNELANEKGCGSIVVIENVFHYKQVIPLQMGDNVIGRYMKGSDINCPIETNDPSIDMTHCIAQQKNKTINSISFFIGNDIKCADKGKPFKHHSLYIPTLQGLLYTKKKKERVLLPAPSVK